MYINIEKGERNSDSVRELDPPTGGVESTSQNSVILSIITPIWRIKIIPESCQTPHSIHHWKEDDISDGNDYDKDQ